MKKIFFALFFIVLDFYALADVTFTIDKNKSINIRTSEDSLEVYFDFIKNSKQIDTYVIEAIGPDRTVQSIYHYNIDGYDYIFIDFYLGNPGGFQKVNKRNLFVFELFNNQIVLKHNIELTSIVYSSKAKKYIDTKNYWFFFEPSTNSIVLYDEKDFILTELKRIKLGCNKAE